MDEFKQNLKLMLGQLMLENIELVTKLQVAEKKIAELEAKEEPPKE